MKHKYLLLVVCTLLLIPVSKINSKIYDNNDSITLSPNAMIPLEEWVCEDSAYFAAPPLVVNLDKGGNDDIIACLANSVLRVYRDYGVIDWGVVYSGELFGVAVADLVGGDELLEILVCEDNYLHCMDEGANYWTYIADSDIQAAPTVADINNDSNLEVIFATTGGSVYCVSYIGDFIWSFDIGSYYTSPIVCDLDKDGLFEILVAPNSGDFIYCLNNTGGLKWQGYVGTGTGKSLGVADLTGDGTFEIVTVQDGIINCHNSSGYRLFYRNIVPGSVAPPIFADFYNNGSLEMLLLRSSADFICYSSNLYEIWSVNYPVNNEYVAISDLDNDNHEEIVFASSDQIICLDYTSSSKWTYNLAGIVPYAQYPIICEVIGSYDIADIVYSHAQGGFPFYSTRCISFTNVAQSSEQKWHGYRGSIFHTGFTDSDGDMLDDLTEESLQINKTNKDSDGDLMKDGIEFLYYHTNPASNDSDSDQLPDNWEIFSYLDPLNPDDASWDYDSDGLSNLEEYFLKTVPFMDDTDLDGMKDGWEVNNGLNPLTNDTGLDPDLDNLVNIDEYLLGTDPQDNDTDNDLMLDGWEVSYTLDPLVDDSSGDLDSDGLTNIYEYNITTNPNYWDTDLDEMSDGWEVSHGFNPLLDDTSDDPDTDGLDNLGEYQAGTDPFDNDTDNDIMLDGWEVLYGLNPLLDDSNSDLDSDGVLNIFEYYNNTNPNSVDSDSDGMPDNWEMIHNFNPLLDDSNGDLDTDGLSNLGEYLAGTDPDNIDTDNDTMPDGFEVSGGINPLLNDTTEDPDGDGINNLEEYGYGTNPSSSDTDNDNTPDDWEILFGFDPLIFDSDEDLDFDNLTNYFEYYYSTDPHLPDTDADGLFDGAEVFTYFTNPLLSDTDGDGFLDGEEIFVYGTDPLNQYSFPNIRPKWKIFLIVFGVIVAVTLSLYFGIKRGIFSSMVGYFQDRLKTRCFACGNPIEQNDTQCSKCRRDILKCSVCKLQIKYKDNVAITNCCTKIGHKVHLLEHLKITGKCPNCLRNINPQDLEFYDDPLEVYVIMTDL